MASPGLPKEISNETVNSWAPSWHFTDREVREKDFQILKQEPQLLLWQKFPWEQAGKELCSAWAGWNSSRGHRNWCDGAAASLPGTRNGQATSGSRAVEVVAAQSVSNDRLFL